MKHSGTMLDKVPPKFMSTRTLRIWPYWIMAGPKSNIWCPYMKAIWWQRKRMEWCIYKLRNSKDCWQPPKRGREQILPQCSRTNQRCWHLDFRLLASSHLVCGHLLRQPEETHTAAHLIRIPFRSLILLLFVLILSLYSILTLEFSYFLPQSGSLKWQKPKLALIIRDLLLVMYKVQSKMSFSDDNGDSISFQSVCFAFQKVTLTLGWLSPMVTGCLLTTLWATTVSCSVFIIYFCATNCTKASAFKTTIIIYCLLKLMWV